jgi:SAM-dependent methyltransferase
MDVSAPLEASASATSATVIWHDIECGSYNADLPLWRELATRRKGDAPVLDVGSGSGRVALDLARGGHQVTAIDRDADLIAALRERAGALPVSAVCADARSFTLERRDHGLCIVPMQTIQLLADAEQRGEFLHRAHAHLAPGGLLACAIVTEIDPFDCSAGDRGPAPDTGLVEGRVHRSRAIRVHGGEDGILIERERTVQPAGRRDAASPAELDVIRLAPLRSSQLLAEGERAGFTPGETFYIGETAEHTGSIVVSMHA